ncbi:hypothetical protein ACVNHC_09985 [Pannonibacter sp. Q-1]
MILLRRLYRRSLRPEAFEAPERACPALQSQLKGGTAVVSVFLPAGSINVLKRLKLAKETGRVEEVLSGAYRVPDGWRPVSGVGAQINAPAGFKTYRTIDGDLVHVSPGGLVYGADPKFGNRLDHVLDHTAPNPNKPVHSVFNVQGDDALKLVDEAWSNRTGAGTHSGQW